MATGKLKMFNCERGYGFITDEGGGGDIFVHISEVQRSGLDPDDLKVGMRLAYETGQGRNSKLIAVELQKA